MSPPVRREAVGNVLRLTLADPATRNSLSRATMEALKAELDAPGDARAVVIAAEGPAYCSGHNLKEIQARRNDPDRGAEFFRTLMEQCAALMRAIVRHPLPVIAEVHAVAAAAGCQLVASCDLAVAADTARFVTPGVNIGLFCSTPMVALSRNVAPKHAMEMLLTGEAAGAEEARRIGLVNRVVAPDRLRAETDALAALVASKPRATVRTGKEAFYRQMEMPLDEAYAYAARVMTENLLHRESAEGIGAFVDKREPRWDTT